MKDRLFISFSGGRTSAYMTKRLLDEHRGRKDIVVLFANTGREDERTLRFVDRCDKEFGFGTVWLEAVVHPERGVGTTHRIVDFNTASRSGEPFEAAIQKFGIPNKNFPHCTRELKQRPMYSYVRALGWKPGTFSVAIGIRADEIDRVSLTAHENGIEYPLVDWGVRKPEILSWFRQQAFDLYAPEHFGNCVTCWKKSDRKLLTIAKYHPEEMVFTANMESRYGYSGPGLSDRPRCFFRGRRSTQDIVALAQQPFQPFVDGNQIFDPDLDIGSGCEDSCEVFTAEFMSDLANDEVDIFA